MTASTRNCLPSHVIGRLVADLSLTASSSAHVDSIRRHDISQREIMYSADISAMLDLLNSEDVFRSMSRIENLFQAALRCEQVAALKAWHRLCSRIHQTAYRHVVSNCTANSYITYKGADFSGQCTDGMSKLLLKIADFNASISRTFNTVKQCVMLLFGEADLIRPHCYIIAINKIEKSPAISIRKSLSIWEKTLEHSLFLCDSHQCAEVRPLRVITDTQCHNMDMIVSFVDIQRSFAGKDEAETIWSDGRISPVRAHEVLIGKKQRDVRWLMKIKPFPIDHAQNENETSRTNVKREKRSEEREETCLHSRVISPHRALSVLLGTKS